MSYAYSVEPWGNCEAEGKAAMGKRTRGVKCLGANGAEYSDLYCPGAPPATEEPCQITTSRRARQRLQSLEDFCFWLLMCWLLNFGA